VRRIDEMGMETIGWRRMGEGREEWERERNRETEHGGERTKWRGSGNG